MPVFPHEGKEGPFDLDAWDTANMSGSDRTARQGQGGPLAGQSGRFLGAAPGRELFARAASEEEAQSIADLYGIALVRYVHGVASYHTEEDPGAVVARGVENGWPRLEINRRQSILNGPAGERAIVENASVKD